MPDFSPGAVPVARRLRDEETARMGLLTRRLGPALQPPDPVVRDKHFLRRHGPEAAYGQGGSEPLRVRRGGKGNAGEHTEVLSSCI